MLDIMALFNETATCSSPFILNASFVPYIPVFLLYLLLLLLSNLLGWLMRGYTTSMEQIGQRNFSIIINSYIVEFLNCIPSILVRECVKYPFLKNLDSLQRSISISTTQQNVVLGIASLTQEQSVFFYK